MDMDYTNLLNIAKDNKDEAERQPMVRRYSTAISAAKKMERSRVQSDAIKSFLRKKEQEELRKAVEAEQRKQDLLSLRAAAKHNRRATVMAKRTKDNNFAASFDQPLETDVPKKETEPKTMNQEVIQNLRLLKLAERERQRKAMQSSEEARPKVREADVPRREAPNVKSAKQNNSAKPNDSAKSRAQSPERVPEKKPVKPKVPPKPVNFFDLLNLAKEKQFEPIKIPVRREAEGRPMTQEEKDRHREENNRKVVRSSGSYSIPKKPTAPPADKDPKPAAKTPTKQVKMTDVAPKKMKSKAVTDERKNIPAPKSVAEKVTTSIPPPKAAAKSNAKPDSQRRAAEPSRPPAKESPAKPAPPPPQKVPPKRPPPKESPAASLQADRDALMKRKMMMRDGGPARNGPPPRAGDVPRNIPQRKPGVAPPRPGMPSRDFPRHGMPSRDFPRPMPRHAPRMPVRRRIESDSEEDEEMDDFIDDGPIDGEEDFSKHIREIFGYDRRSYTFEREDDVDDMESSFVQQMKEEAYSARMGLKEDLDDIRKEEEELKRKKMLTAKRRKL